MRHNLCLLLLLVPWSEALAVPEVLRPEQTEAIVIWRDNATNADRVADRIAGWFVRWEAAGSARRMLTRNTGGFAGWKVELEAWPEFEGLNRVAIGPVLGWRHKFGLGARVPVLQASVTGARAFWQEDARSGLAGTARVELRQRLGESWQVQLAHEWVRYDARGRAFDHTGQEWIAECSGQLSRRWQWRLALSRRDGDVVSYTTPPRHDLVQAGKVLTLVDTFERATPLLAYYFPATTKGGTIELAREFSDRLVGFGRLDYHDTRHNAVRYLNRNITMGARWRW